MLKSQAQGNRTLPAWAPFHGTVLWSGERRFYRASSACSFARGAIWHLPNPYWLLYNRNGPNFGWRWILSALKYQAGRTSGDREGTRFGCDGNKVAPVFFTAINRKTTTMGRVLLADRERCARSGRIVVPPPVGRR